MANQITDRVHAQVKFDPANPPVILSQTPNIASVVRTAAGVYDVTMTDALDAASESLAACIAADFSSEAAELAGAVVEKVSQTVYTVRTFDDLGAVGDLPGAPVGLAVYVVRQD